MVGAGGSGAYCTTFYGGSGGGGSGAYLKAYFPNNVSATLTCFVGQGGLAQATTNNDGFDGGASYISSGLFQMTCNGGMKGLKGSETSGGAHGQGGLGGDVSIVNLNTLTFSPSFIRVTGGDGCNANGGAASVLTFSGGNGGASYFGSGGRGSVTTNELSANGRAFGSGGGGSRGPLGGYGASGCIFFKWTL